MKTEVWAHRGASGYAPENTLEAFELAVKQGADGVELDVQLSKDGELVVIHDEVLDRVSDGTGWVKDFTLEELKKRTVNQTHPEYTGSKIPTLGEVYELLKPTSLCINVELKTGIVFYPKIEEKVLELTKRAGMAERVWYSSFNHATLVRLKELEPFVKTGVLYADGWLEPWNYAKKIGADALHPALYNMQFEGYLEESRKLGLSTHVWTVNEKEQMEIVAKAGVEALITNYPDQALEVIKKLGGRKDV